MTSRGTLGILGYGAYVPPRVMENAEWSEHVDTTDEWIRSRTGIERRRIAGEDETTATMAVAAARRALADAGIGARDVDEIVVATDTPEVFIPDTSAFVQHMLGAREVPSYDLAGSGCAGFLQALDVARCRVADPMRKGRRILVVGVELLSRLMNWKDRSTAVLFGDGAGAAVVGDTRDHGGGEILAATAGTDGSRWDILCLETGGTRRPFTLEAAQAGSQHDVVMQGREVFREAVARMSEAAREVLRQAGKSLEDVDLVVPHQANLRIISAVTKALGAPSDKVYVNVQDYGNTGSASIPIALDGAREEGRIGRGDLVLLTSFGAGFHWGATLVRL
jgi:3-oxoacyl-[acyl-carrier-protein] synthase-3